MKPGNRRADNLRCSGTACPPSCLLRYCSLLLLDLLLLIAAGCASSNINSPAPRANTGYVDVYSLSDTDLCWNVQVSRASGGDFKTVFSDVKPPESGVLRLAFAPGHHTLRITFLNRVISKPAQVEVEVENGKITPVAVALTGAGATTVVSKQTIIGGSPSLRGGRQTRVNTDETVMYDISAVPAAPVSYQPKEQMPYSSLKNTVAPDPPSAPASPSPRSRPLRDGDWNRLGSAGRNVDPPRPAEKQASQPAEGLSRRSEAIADEEALETLEETSLDIWCSMFDVRGFKEW